MKITCNVFLFVAILVSAFVLSPGLAAAQAKPTPPDMAIDAAVRASTVDNLFKELNDSYVFPESAGNKTEEFWTKSSVPGKKYGEKDVYLLTSNRTFSAAEEFSYNLKNLKRATIIGETTGGGAHPGDMVRLGDHFGVFIPSGRAISPITKTNWEGTGVEPDIKVPKDEALKTAYLMALKKSLANIKDDNVKGGVKGLIDQTQKELDEIKKSATK